MDSEGPDAHVLAKCSTMVIFTRKKISDAQEVFGKSGVIKPLSTPSASYDWTTLQVFVDQNGRECVSSGMTDYLIAKTKGPKSSNSRAWYLSNAALMENLRQSCPQVLS